MTSSALKTNNIEAEGNDLEKSAPVSPSGKEGSRANLIKWVSIGILGVLVVILTLVVIYQAMSTGTENSKDKQEHQEPEPVVKIRTEKIIQIQNVTVTVTVNPVNTENPVTSITPGTSDPPENTCTSDVCVQAANHLLIRINPDVDPCEDFYENACGSFEENNVIQTPGGTTNLVTTAIVESALFRILNSEESHTEAEKQLKKYWVSCLEYEPEDDATEEVLDAISEIGKWPVVDESFDNVTDFMLTDFLINMAKSGHLSFGFFEIHMVFSPDGVRNSQIIVEKPSFSEVDNAYPVMMSLAAQRSNNSVDDMKQLHNFNQYLEYKMKETKPKTKKIGNLENLQKWVPNVDWKKFFTSLVPKKYQNQSEEFLGRIRVEHANYFENQLPEILKNFDSRVLANFLIYRWVVERLPVLDMMMTDPDTDEEDEDEDERDKMQQSNCHDIVTALMPLNLGMAYVYRYIKHENVEGASEIVEVIREEFKQLVKESVWMDEKSKNDTILKIERLTKNIAYPKHFNDTKLLEKRYENLKIDETESFFKNFQKTLKWRLEADMLDIAENTINDFKEIYIVNANYDRNLNSLNVGAPRIRLPWYDVGVPDYYNYGVLGATIGHEMGHGFDEKGIQKNADWELKPLYTNETKTKFDEIQKCFIDTYSSYKYPGFEHQQINGNLSNRENMADYTGMQLIYRAAKRFGPQPKLPGLQKYDDMKILFYAFASKRCSNSIDEETFERRNSASHGFGRFRVNGVASNFEGFSEVFGCKKGSPMNPDKKCKIY